jgi:hypothetical protein
MNIAFKEEQKFTQWWLWIILIGIGILPVIGIYKQLILGEQFGNKPMSNLGLILFSLIIFSLLVLFRFMNLQTEINKYEIKMNYFPFVKKRVYWKDVKSAKVVNYGFVGYGIRFGSKYGTVYNINGKKGLAIELQNGKKFVIGTQKENELNKVVEKAREQKQQHI